MKKFEVTMEVKSDLTSRQLEELISDSLDGVEGCQVSKQISVDAMPEPPSTLPAVNNPLSCTYQG